MFTRLKTFTIEAHGRSDVGLVRENNEDALFLAPEHNVFVLADGMGGHSAGEVAAKEAVDAFHGLVKNYLSYDSSGKSLDECKEILNHCIVEVNREVFRVAQRDQDLRGMGTTLCCVYFHSEGVVLGHVGDSRIYRVRNGILEQMTQDHSLVAELLELGELNQRQAREFTQRHIITKAIGTEPNVTPDVAISDIREGDFLMLCSDGLTDIVSPRVIEAIINQSSSVQGAVDQLIDAANSGGGNDNTTVMLLKVYGQEN